MLNAVQGGDPMTTHGSSSFRRCQHRRRCSALRKSHDLPECLSTIKSKLVPASIFASSVSRIWALTRGGLNSSVTTCRMPCSFIPVILHSLLTCSFASNSCAAPLMMASATSAVSSVLALLLEVVLLEHAAVQASSSPSPSSKSAHAGLAVLTGFTAIIGKNCSGSRRE